MEDHQLYWGEIHTHTDLSDGNGSVEDNFEIAGSHLDFWAMADHAYDREVFRLNYAKRAPGRRLLNDDWGRVQDLCRAREEPGTFIPFLAYEWTNFRYGHHNVYYLDYDQPIRMPPTLPELYESLRGVDALVIPHHGGYPVGICGKDWDCHDEGLSPFVEIYSLHGSSEEPAGIRPLLTRGSWMGPGASGGSVQEGLARGYRLGIMASSDSHGDHPGAYDNGLIAAYARELTRPSLWESLVSKRIYGVTGDRIVLDFVINGQPMGSSLVCKGARSINISVIGWDKVERVDIIKNNALLHSFIEPAGGQASGVGALRFRFMAEWGWDQRGGHDWESGLEIARGRILQAALCYRGSVASRKGTGVTQLAASDCRWTSRTEKPRAWGFSRGSADAMAFEVECDPDAELRFVLRCDDLERELLMSPTDILSRSTIAYAEEIPPTDNGAHWSQMSTYAKTKIHQGTLTADLTLELSYEDQPDEPAEGRTDFYYVRVIQRNGQRAWSSPIWVEP